MLRNKGLYSWFYGTVESYEESGYKRFGLVAIERISEANDWYGGTTSEENSYKFFAL